MNFVNSIHFPAEMQSLRGTNCRRKAARCRKVFLFLLKWLA